MPFISTDNSLGQGLAGLGSALFPDPTRQAQAGYMGAHARSMDAGVRKSDQETSDLAEQARNKALLPGAYQEFQRNPNGETGAKLISIGQGAGLKLSDVLPGGLAANSLGTNALPAQQTDAAIGRAGGAAYTSSPSGQAATNQTAITQTRISSGPAYQREALERQKYGNERNAYTNDKGETVYLRPGETPGTDYQPTDRANQLLSQRIATEPASRAQTLKEREYGDARIPYTDPRTGETTYLKPGETPASNYMPTDKAAPVLSSVITTQPALNNSRKPAPYVVPTNDGQGGRTTQYIRQDEVPPPGAVPYNEQAPIQSGIGTGLFPPPAPPVPPGAGQVASAPTAPPSHAPGGNVAAEPAVSTVPPGGVSAPDNAPPTLGQTIVPPAAPRPPDQFTDLARNAGVGVGNQAGETAKDDVALGKAIDTRVKAYNKENNAGLRGVMTRDFNLSDDARSALQTRAAQLARDRGNRVTYNNIPEALNQAWREQSATWERDGSVNLPGTGPSLLRPRAAAQAPSVAPGATAPPAAPAPAPATRTAPPAAPSAGVPPVAQRQVGQTYNTPRGPMVWAGTGWQPPEIAGRGD